MRRQKSPIDFAVKSASDPRILAALLHAPSCLSGLTETEHKHVRERARTALHPQQVLMEELLTKARDELREGLAAAKRAVLERCGMSEDRDSMARDIREPLPRGALGATRATAGKTTTENRDGRGRPPQSS